MSGKKAPTQAQAPAQSNKKKSHHYEFGGPVGTALNLFSLPLVVYSLYFLCNEKVGCVKPSPPFLDRNPLPFILDSLPFLFNWKSFAVVVVWFLFLSVQYFALGGQKVTGVKLATGNRLVYNVNGFRSYLFSLVTVGVLAYLQLIDLTFIYDNFVPLLSSATILSYLLAFYLYATSFFPGKLLAHPSGNVFYDFWMGRELNPRIGQFDLKYFCELRPGMIGWIFIEISMIAKHFQLYGHVSNSLLLIFFFHFWYVTDALWSEHSILTTMDITTDGFGFMLAFGDLVWVPFTFSVQSRYLVDFPHELSFPALIGVLALQLIGYFIFRGANAEKDTFRTNRNHPDVKHLKYIETKAGSALITSGWWGRARHINYFGDYLMGISWCLPCGSSHVIPYFYIIYFAALLIHRERRDDHKCSLKYGEDWKKYCQLVPYRIIPYVY